MGKTVSPVLLGRLFQSPKETGLSQYTQIQTIRHNPRGLYYPGKSGDFHVTSFHFRVAKKRPQFNECVMNCNVLMYYKCKIMSKYYLFITNYISKYFSALIDVCF